MTGSRGAGTTPGGKLETVILSLVFLLGVAAGYIGHDKIWRVRHERAQIELS
jgi:hypothetical protein